ncbi:GIY-YIG nuclease family protein [Maribacter sp. SA7]|uniref:GIY-YIG nuclease family protein n=1 Tax=Maribacter zhoushanensis TaxID=3030012 RepID=UPI0023EB1863|nr:GIY-YIG nuclease family protein [Maribacter zhoushanensis]MDF4201922.1 GIY-YIG nuclease family protein [Maribacter zhoushanensis]
MINYYVYILKCADSTFYTGITSNLTQRLESHQTGKYKDSYTSKRKPVTLVFYCEFTNPNIAIETEKRIKKWSQAKKRALIAGKYDELPNLAKKKFS